MNVEKCNIQGIPAILWGEPSDKWIIAVHGYRSSKIDDCIWILAEEAAVLGYQVLSFDLPCHGERVYEEEPMHLANCVEDLQKVMAYARERTAERALFGCSLGAYLSLLAYKQEPLAYAWFLSPVLALEGLSEPEAAYAKAHPITVWNPPTYILRGEHDALCSREDLAAAADRFGWEIEEQKGGEHWFHTPEQLDDLRKWLREAFRSTEEYMWRMLL